MTLSTDRTYLLYGGAITMALLVFGLAAYFAFEDVDAWKDTLSRYLETARGTPWALPFVCLTYVVGGAVLFPVMILNLAVAVVFGLWGIVYALLGTVASAFVFFCLGRLLKKKYGEKLHSFPKVQKVDETLTGAGVAGVVAVHLVPVPPYSIVSLTAGLTSITLFVYLVGTFISMLPGAIARGVIGDSLTKLLLDPSHESYLYLLMGVLLWVVLVTGSHFAFKKFQPA